MPKKTILKKWNDDGREWRESVLKCSTLERFESTEDNKVQHEVYRKKIHISEYFSQDISAAPTEKKNKKKLLFRYVKNNVSVLRRRCKA